MQRVTDITQQNSHLPKSNGHDHTTACVLGHTDATFKMYAEMNTCYGSLCLRCSTVSMTKMHCGHNGTLQTQIKGRNII